MKQQEAKSKKELIILIVIIALATVAWIFFFYIHGMKQVSEPYVTAEDPFVINDAFFDEYVIELGDTEISEEVVDVATDKDDTVNTKKKEVIPVVVPEKPKNNTTILKNDNIGVSLEYPDIFQYGINPSKKGTMIQIATFNLNTYFDGPEPPGIKVEIITDTLKKKESLLDYAISVEGMDQESVYFEDIKINGVTGLKRYTQENQIANLVVHLKKDKTVYSIFIYSNVRDYDKYEDLLDAMINSIEIGV
ncbi:MAG: hypothetical protein Q8P90_02580 [bacterium]|nr:hypothetical protein [bacterium]